MERPKEKLSENLSWNLTPEELRHFDRFKEQTQKDGRPMVLWGWKRDKIVDRVRYPESRTVYFSADLDEKNGKLFISRGFFFLDTRASHREIETLRKSITSGISTNVWRDAKFESYSRLQIMVGTPTSYDQGAIERRLKGKPRVQIPEPRLIPRCTEYDLSRYAPFALCVGSGLSAESGLPLLGSIHQLFEVDNTESGELIFGAMDNLPKRISEDPEAEFEKFCQFTVDAIKAKPSASHLMIADLYKKGVIKEVFTDNMDDILGKVDVPYTKTRLSIFPDRFPVEFNPQANSLLVVGVAVDRRDVIKQARYAGLKIISINPTYGVAPHSRNMDYLCRGDLFFRETAKEALPKIITESGF